MPGHAKPLAHRWYEKKCFHTILCLSSLPVVLMILGIFIISCMDLFNDMTMKSQSIYTQALDDWEGKSWTDFTWSQL